jgi:hypothetical protein
MRLIRKVVWGGILFVAVVATAVYHDLRKPCPAMGVERLNSTDRVRISDNGNRTVREISDSASISAAALFAFGSNRRWRAAWLGKPMGAVDVSFLHGEDLVGQFSIGRDFLSTFACGEFRTHTISSHERIALLKLLAIRDPEGPSS